MLTQNKYESIIADLTHQLYRARLISRGWKKLAKLERATIVQAAVESAVGDWDDDGQRERVIQHHLEKFSSIRETLRNP